MKVVHINVKPWIKLHTRKNILYTKKFNFKTSKEIDKNAKTDDRQSGKLTCAFSSGELKGTKNS